MVGAGVNAADAARMLAVVGADVVPRILPDLHVGAGGAVQAVGRQFVGVGVVRRQQVFGLHPLGVPLRPPQQADIKPVQGNQAHPGCEGRRVVAHSVHRSQLQVGIQRGPPHGRQAVVADLGCGWVR